MRHYVEDLARSGWVRVAGRAELDEASAAVQESIEIFQRLGADLPEPSPAICMTLIRLPLTCLRAWPR